MSNEWLEKQSVALYSLAQVQEMLRRNPDEFRSYFLIVIRQVMQQFAAPSPPGAVVSVRDTYRLGRRRRAPPVVRRHELEGKVDRGRAVAQRRGDAKKPAARASAPSMARSSLRRRRTSAMEWARWFAHPFFSCAQVSDFVMNANKTPTFSIERTSRPCPPRRSVCATRSRSSARSWRR